MAIMLIPSGFLADFCQVKGYLTTTQVRRYFNCGGFIAQTVFMLLAAYLAHPVYSIISLVTAVGLGAFSISGFAVNHLDIAPQFSSILMGISNTAGELSFFQLFNKKFAKICFSGTIPGILSPIITGFIVQHKVSIYQSLSSVYSLILFTFFDIGRVH